MNTRACGAEMRYHMPFINSKISTSLTEAQETEIKTRLGQAIQTIPGKSESWLMVGFEPDYKLYFRGSNAEPIAMVEVSVYGSENPSAFSKLTGYAERHGIKEGTDN